MTKKQKFDENGDSEDLQALFDSIASGDSPQPKLEVVSASRKVDVPDGDDDALQALFDSVAAEFGGDDVAPGATAAACAASASAVAAASGSPDAVFNRIGQMTRQVHDTLRALGCENVINEAVQAIPDARQRLNYIAVMTEQAASRVLNATDIAMPLQDKIAADAVGLEKKWDQLFANQLSVEEFKALAGDTRKFLGSAATSSIATNQQLMEIMMAQDFQDLTGQVIKKVVDLAQTLESGLLQILLEVMPEEKRVPFKTESLMNGPVVNAQGREDVVTSQEQVDDLLDSLGF
jgi:chemotaxis protein CheZ